MSYHNISKQCTTRCTMMQNHTCTMIFTLIKSVFSLQVRSEWYSRLPPIFQRIHLSSFSKRCSTFTLVFTDIQFTRLFRLSQSMLFFHARHIQRAVAVFLSDSASIYFLLYSCRRTLYITLEVAVRHSKSWRCLDLIVHLLHRLLGILFRNPGPDPK